MADKTRLNLPLTKKRQLEQDLEHVTQEMYKRNLELAETNRTLSLLRTIDNLTLESHSTLTSLADQITEAIIANSNYAVVAMLTKEERDPHFCLNGMSTAEVIGQPEVLNKLKGYKVSISQEWLGSPQQTALLSAPEMQLKTILDYTGLDPQTATELVAKLPLQSLRVIKLNARQRVVGLLLVGFIEELGSLPESDIPLLDRVSQATGLAIDSKMLYEENQHVLLQLRNANEKLIAMDQTKDDFISMASHQLRTPLTSVKGYISMVLEGDVGKITDEQRKLLDQAFLSAQRMVYLIADLLNVSRLKTGKFIIESKPTNLAEIVAGELEQLKETAAARDLEMKFDPPRDFPMLNLDETKIRQVIMNFVDNAIYYTPTGGHIQVAVVDKGETVEFTVSDDGIGVPKNEQHNLFNKFYRAGNARKARPDGTGLGLFMAKKVVIAQGGSIIFKTAEDKGSTFGFSFEKKKLTPGTHSVNFEDTDESSA